MPNAFAFLVLFSAPVVAFILFRVFQPVLASALTLVLGYLFLPSATEVDFPVLPPIDKFTITVASVLLFSVVALRAAAAQRKREERGLFSPGKAPEVDTLPGWLPASHVAKILMLIVAVSGLFTGFANREPRILGGDGFLVGYDLYSTLALSMLIGINLIPFVIGRKLFGHPEGQKTLLMVIAGSALAYSVLVLFEVRMSPQLNNWIYGFFSGDFGQAMRSDGFRPLVFLQHGLWLAIFNCMAVIAAVGAYRAKAGSLSPGFWAATAIWLFLVLFLSNSLGAFLIALVMLPVAFVLTSRTQLLFAACIGLVALTYPVMRERGIVPVKLLSDIASGIDPARAKSFNFRLRNEDQFLDHAGAKPLTGWGRFERSFVFDPESGRRVTTIDGYWIVTFAEGGYLRYIGEYGLLTFAFFQILMRRKTLNIGPETAVLSLVLAANLVDMIPNATSTVLTWLIAGALLGRLEIMSAAQAEDSKDVGTIRGGRMRHRAAAGVRPPVKGPGVVATSVAAQEAPRKDASSNLESVVPDGRGDQYSRFSQVHSRKLREDRPSSPRQNFRRKTEK